MPGAEVVAAGAVVFRPGREVLLVHRQRYDDWSFPKGKLDRGEHRLAAAVREVEEETGLRVRLGLPLADQRYPVQRGTKTVHYWVGRVSGSDDVSRYAVNDEIDRVAWVPIEEAQQRLTYSRDRVTLAEAVPQRRRTDALVVLRHASARSRRTWRGDDRQRPLLAVGRIEAARLVPILDAYRTTRIVSSSSTRCVETVAPYAAAARRPITERRQLTEEDATPKAVAGIVDGVVDELAGSGGATVLCTHRPVLPAIFARLGVRDPQLMPAEMVVLHLRKGQVVGVEQHGAR